MAVGPAVTTAYDTGALLGSTLANYRDKFEDNVSSNVALWWKLKQDGQVKKKVSGGERAVVQLLTGFRALDVSPAHAADVENNSPFRVAAASVPAADGCVIVPNRKRDPGLVVAAS